MLQELKAKLKAKALVIAGVGASSLSLLAVPSFASEVDGALQNVAITSDMLQPLLDGISSNISVILPVGIAVFAIFVGVSILPKIVKKFTSA